MSRLSCFSFNRSSTKKFISEQITKSIFFFFFNYKNLKQKTIRRKMCIVTKIGKTRHYHMRHKTVWSEKKYRKIEKRLTSRFVSSCSSFSILSRAIKRIPLEHTETIRANTRSYKSTQHFLLEFVVKIGFQLWYFLLLFLNKEAVYENFFLPNTSTSFSLIEYTDAKAMINQ